MRARDPLPKRGRRLAALDILAVVVYWVGFVTSTVAGVVNDAVKFLRRGTRER